MRKYNPNALYSFKFNDKINKEIKMSRTFTRKGKEYTDIFYCETTDIPDILIVPDSITCNNKNDAPHGFTGDIKEGIYKLNGKTVKLYNAHQIYNGIAFVNYREVD